MRERLRIEFHGAVQGVGFRPFVYRLADELGLDGFVGNDPRGVVVEVEGERIRLERFLERASAERPAAASIETIATTWLAPAGLSGFRIVSSREDGAKTVQLLADLATCADCLREIFDPADRRSGYPFTNCTRCGPRFTIVRSLPYDRPRTTMAAFPMCAACRAEYEGPSDRRFHAQPNACPECGPELALWNAQGRSVARGPAALAGAAAALAEGMIVAVKGLGGFHLMVDAANAAAIARLRERKVRRDKPLALLVRDREQAAALCFVDESDARALEGPEAPILLLPRRPEAPVCASVAPGNPRLGLMLPCMPLHHLLMREAPGPLVATSGNLSEEPICTDEREALERLGGIAECFLVHDRPIARHADDSVAWRLRGETRLLRRARGFAPRPVLLGREVPTLLAVGAQLKNAVALSLGRRVFLSQHIGDMESAEALAAFERVIADFLEIYDAVPVALAHDLHPDYVTTRWAQEAVDPARGERPARAALARLAGLPQIAVQHHHAHLASCLAEHPAETRALGVTWDGTGYGGDGTVWGGEFLAGGAAAFRRVARLRPFRLAGGEQAVREPRRAALGLLWEIEGRGVLERPDLEPLRAFQPAELALLGRMLETGAGSPVTTSAGRLFDGLAALVGLHQRATFEGQAAMALEHAADPDLLASYPLDLRLTEGIVEVDWRPLLDAVLRDLARGTARAEIAARVHNGLAAAIVAVAREVGEPSVALSGGCFQNRLLTERTAAALEEAGFRVLLQREVPPGDGGIGLGQILVAAARLAGSGEPGGRV